MNIQKIVLGICLCFVTPGYAQLGDIANSDKKVGVDKDTKVKDLTEEQVGKIRTAVEEYKIEGELRKEIRLNIKRLLDIKSYRGLRHRNGLPVRGQKTKTNARTRKGPVKMAIAKKK